MGPSRRGRVATQANAEVSYGPAASLLDRGCRRRRALAAAGRGPRGGLAPGGDRRRPDAGSRPTPARAASHYAGHGMATASPARRTSWPPRCGRRCSPRTGGRAALIDACSHLDVAEATGGDIRGRQSAAILVVPAQGDPWDTVVSLRVEDHPEPLSELAGGWHWTAPTGSPGRRRADGGRPSRGGLPPV